MILLAYFAVTLAALAGLTAMILAVAKTLGQCPDAGPRARAAGLTIVTGYLSIGGGAVLLITTLPAIGAEAGILIFAMGLACVILGLGFTQAVTTLRTVLSPAAQPAAHNRPKVEDVPMEPVLA